MTLFIKRAVAPYISALGIDLFKRWWNYGLDENHIKFISKSAPLRELLSECVRFVCFQFCSSAGERAQLELASSEALSMGMVYQLWRIC